jgi:2-polyprenyl-3-methyl-5-hydroxy-6-metoxy-1,4-benzoquinol methylase
MFEKVVRNNHGFYTLKKLPTPNELEQYYSDKYYQNPQGSYQVNYSPEEIKYFNNKIAQKYIVILELLNPKFGFEKPSFLDVGCGEGWALKFFKEKLWEIIGLDYSTYGCEKHNPDCSGHIKSGEINANIDLLIKEKSQFDVIWLDNILEHVLDPFALLVKCNKLIKDRGIIVIEVPNDFSMLQRYLFNNGNITDPFWVAIPDHISYFNQEGLISLCKEAGWACKHFIVDFPIDLNLFNENTNYVQNKQVGKNCHQARVKIENFLHELSPEKTNKLYTVLAELGLGRELAGFFQKE